MVELKELSQKKYYDKKSEMRKVRKCITKMNLQHRRQLLRHLAAIRSGSSLQTPFIALE